MAMPIVTYNYFANYDMILLASCHTMIDDQGSLFVGIPKGACGDYKIKQLHT